MKSGEILPLPPGMSLSSFVPRSTDVDLEVAADAAAIWGRANAQGADPATFGRQVVEVFRASCAAAGCRVPPAGK